MKEQSIRSYPGIPALLLLIVLELLAIYLFVRGVRPDDIRYDGPAAALAPVWLDLRAAMRGVLEETTLADVVARSGRA